ncbi:MULTISPECIES: CaiB/BaiF CoA-transferase family protein [unclassified Rhodococcus (in: high G+C Gram-positive bacteria)]|uniref:CaiB/BaiF CoA transferase family protein n=1 Tax=unclassified Rhodococcus (in: high G+C Gram-positive bacteria) TaxID=192944 RepID=UPI00163AA4C0|nr:MULTISPECIES: CaiB/BaiF CoA-transferase family protein [unclassified Rhodococcus (in: high G+C Gram-positive bacteria)]MBC2640856.1 CoA transferase [Rhodococcus sp. 3A]MBC2894400.1 CoA transferase [Rhodococcus sp. 4CII]
MQHKPLDGIRILEIGGYIALPFATSILCALGAEVVKVEKPVVGEDFRRHQNDGSPYFRQYNTGKRSLSIDLKRPEGVALVKALVPHFDVVLENLRPGKLAALGLGPDDCRALRSDLVYGSVTGFGSGGPLASRPAYDTIGHAFGGLYSLFGDDARPQLAGGLSADLITGLSTATGVLAALVGRLRTGSPQHVETSIMEAVSVLATDGITQSFELGYDPSRQSRHPQAQNFCVKTATGEYLAVHLSSSQKFWRSLCTAMNRMDLTEDPRFAEYRSRESNYHELAKIVEAEFEQQSLQHWEDALSAADVPFAPVLSMTGFVEHEQVEWLELVERQQDGLALIRPPWRFAGERPDRAGTAPRVGADSRDVASEVYSAEQIDDLVQADVLFVEPGA